MPSLWAILGLKSDGFDRGLKDASKKGQDFGKALGGNFLAATGKLGLLGLAIAGVALPIKKAIDLAEEFGDDPNQRKFVNQTKEKREAMADLARSVQGAKDNWEDMWIFWTAKASKIGQRIGEKTGATSFLKGLQLISGTQTETKFETEQRKRERLKIAEQEVKEAETLFEAQKKLAELEEQQKFSGLDPRGKIGFLKAKSSVLDMQINEAAGVDEFEKRAEKIKLQMQIADIERGLTKPNKQSSDLNAFQKIGAFTTGGSGAVDLLREQRKATVILEKIERKISSQRTSDGVRFQ